MIVKNKIINGIEYTLVDIYDFENIKVYHFVNDDEEIFCKKSGEKYNNIEDEKFITRLKEYYYLDPPEILFVGFLPVEIMKLFGVKNIKTIDDSTRDSFFLEQVELLKKMMDPEILKKRLEDVTLCEADWQMAESGFFHPRSNAIFLRKESFSKDLKKCYKMINLHETIHALSGTITFLSKYSRMKGLIEGATDSIVFKIFDDKSSFFRGKTRYNFCTGGGYERLTALIRQMEYVMGKECDESILLGKTDFFDEFSEKYGKDTFRIIKHRANRLVHPETIEKPDKFFQKTQNFLLERVFDKEFEEIETIEDAKKFMEKLQKFETTRGTELGDKTFEGYYEKYLEQTKKRLKEKKYNESEIAEFVENHKYKRQEYNQVNLDGLLKNSIIDECISNDVFKNEITSQESTIKLFRANDDENGVFYYLIQVNDKMILIADRLEHSARSHYIFINEINYANEVLDMVGKTDEVIGWKRCEINIGNTYEFVDGKPYIKSKDGKIINFEEKEIPEYLKNSEELITMVEDKKAERQREALRKIAEKQPKSLLAKISDKLKGLLNQGKDKSSNNERQDEEKI